MTRKEKEQIRTDFFRLHSHDHGFASVAVRPEKGGGHYIDVGTTEGLELEESYHGLPVRMHSVSPAVNAVQAPNQSA